MKNDRDMSQRGRNWVLLHIDGRLQLVAFSFFCLFLRNCVHSLLYRQCNLHVEHTLIIYRTM